MSFKNQFAALIDLKTILTITLTFTFIYLAIGKVIPVESFMVIFGMVIGWYFTKVQAPSNTITETTTTSTTVDPPKEALK